MRFYLPSIMVLLLAVTTANAEFVVWLSDKAPGENPVAGLLNATLASPSATGNLYLYGDGDTQLSGLSLDVLATGNAIKFTSATVNNPGGRWSFLDGPLTIGDSLITNIGGAAIPPGAPGVGGPTTDEIPGIGFHLATIGYMGLGNATSMSNLALRVGSNLIADYDGNAAQVRLGGPQNPLVSGEQQGAQGAAGAIASSVVTNPMIDVLGNGMVIIDGDTTPSTADHTDFGTWFQGQVAQRTFTINNAGDAALTLGAPTFTGPFSLVGAFPSSVAAAGNALFTVGMNTANLGNQAGGISFATNVTAKDPYNFSLAGRVIPEPATMSLVGLALVGVVGLARRRS